MGPNAHKNRVSVWQNEPTTDGRSYLLPSASLYKYLIEGL